MYETELNVINSALLNQGHLGKLMFLDESYFFNNALRDVFTVMKNLHNAGVPVDLPSVIPDIKDKDIISDLIKGNVALNIDYLLDKLKQRKDQHEIKLNSQDLYKAVKDGMDYDQFLDKIVDIRENRSLESDAFEDLSNFTGQELKKIFPRDRFIRTGLSSLDEKVIGFFRKHIIIIGARPGLGKTTLAMQIARGWNTLFFSLEMTRYELYSKLLSAEAKVETWKIETRKYNEEEKYRVSEAHKKIAPQLNLTVFDHDLNYSQIINYCNTMIRIKKPDLIVVDHIGLIGGVPGENQNARISNISRALKLVAMKYDIPVLVLSQFSRDVEKTKREPVLSDLRDSGSLEQDAGLVLFLHENEEENCIIVAKNKKGRTGKISNIKFIKEYSFFDDIPI